MFVFQVSLCSGCNAFHPYASFVIGIIGGMTYVAWSTLMLRVKVDDPLDAVAGKCRQNVQELYSHSQNPQQKVVVTNKSLLSYEM